MSDRATLKRFSAQAVSTGAATDATLVAAVTGVTIYVTKLFVNVITHANAKKTTIQDTNSSPVVVAVINDLTVASGTQGNNQFVFDFGRRGFKLTADKGLRVTDEAAGCVCNVVAEGYTV